MFLWFILLLVVCLYVCIYVGAHIWEQVAMVARKVFQVLWAPLWIVQLNSCPLQKKWVFSFAHSSLQAKDTCSFNIQNVMLLFCCRKEQFAKFHFVNVRTESYSVFKSEISIADYIIHRDWHLSLLKNKNNKYINFLTLEMMAHICV